MRKYNVRFLSVSSLDIIFIRITARFTFKRKQKTQKFFPCPKQLFVFLLQYKYTQKGKPCPHHVPHVEVLVNPLPALLKLLHKAHDVERVHRVDDGGAHGRGPEDGGRVAALGRRPHLVLAPAVAGVAVPGVFHHLRRERD